MARILFLTVIPSPYQRELFAALARTSGHDLAVLYYAATASDRQWQETPLRPYETILDGRTLHRLGGSAHWNPGVLGAIRARRPDLVVVSDYSAPTAQAAMWSLAAKGTPWLFWGEIPGFRRRSAIGRLGRRILQAPIGRASGIAAIGSEAARAYRRLFPGKPVHEIPYFCDLSRFRAAAEAAGGTDATCTILFSGQLIARKGPDLLVEAFGAVARDRPAVRLALVGAGELRARLEAGIAPDLRDRVAFLGHREPAELPRLFASADVFCLPSRHDGWGVVLNEALGAGLPIVASKAAGAAHDLVIPDRNGFRVPPDDAPALAAALARLLDDAALRRRFAAESRRLAGDWDLDAGVARWSAAIAATLADPARRR